MAYLREVVNGYRLEVTGTNELIAEAARQFHLKIIADKLRHIDQERRRLNENRRWLKRLEQRWMSEDSEGTWRHGDGVLL